MVDWQHATNVLVGAIGGVGGAIGLGLGAWLTQPFNSPCLMPDGSIHGTSLFTPSDQCQAVFLGSDPAVVGLWGSVLGAAVGLGYAAWRKLSATES